MAWPTTSRHERGYGTAHDRMRKRVLIEEPLCRTCLAKSPPRYTPSTIADHIKPKAEGGSDERDNYAGSCKPCHDEKTDAESAKARGITLRRQIRIGADGWPIEE